MTVIAPPPVAPRSAYGSWLRRVVATVLDALPVVALSALAWILLLGTRETQCAAQTSEFELAPYCTTGASVLGQVSFAVCTLAACAFAVWNIGVRQGRTGSSLGKKALGIAVVGEVTAQPVGVGRSVLRQLSHILDAVACYIGFLFPLWDARRQTFADKVMHTVCVRT